MILQKLKSLKLIFKDRLTLKIVKSLQWKQEVQHPVSFDYKQILDPYQHTEDQIASAFGKNSSGACIIEHIPNFNSARLKFLQLGDRLAELPEDYLKTLQALESDSLDPHYSKGWHFLKESLAGNAFSLEEAAFVASLDEALNLKSHKYGSQNKWPDNRIPEFRQAFNELSQIIVNVSKLLAVHIDKYVQSVVMTYPKNTLQRIVKEGDHTGHFYHFYDIQGRQKQSEERKSHIWGKWHNDISALTASCPTLYTTDNSIVAEHFDKKGGAFYLNHDDEIIKIKAPEDSLIFHIGETMEILSGGILQATPTCIKKHKKTLNMKLKRNSFDVHFEPLFHEKLTVPGLIEPEKLYEFHKSNNFQSFNEKKQKGKIREGINSVPYGGVPGLKGRWTNGIQYGDFYSNTLKQYRIK